MSYSLELSGVTSMEMSFESRQADDVFDDSRNEIVSFLKSKVTGSIFSIVIYPVTGK